MAQNILEDQRGSIRQMLSLGEASSGPTQTWKVLVFDKFCQDVIAPLLKVGALRNHGVTLHLNLHSERLPVSDVPCVYFVEPTEDNVKRIGEDLAKGLYESCYINFASSVPRSMLEALAHGVLQANSAQKVAGVFDRYVSFVSLSAGMFSLNMPAAYSTIHSPSIADQIMYAYIERIVDGLLSALVTMKTLPIIRCPPNEVAEMVARRLDERIRELLSKGGSDLFAPTSAAPAARGPGSDAGPAASQRPVLCIVDRDVDLVTMVNHTWTYQAMCADILGMRLKKLKVPVDDKEKAYDIDESDSFWSAHAAEPFPVVAEQVHEAIEEFNKRRANMSTNDSGDAGADGLNPNLAAAINALPEMTEKKRSIDMHTNIATALLQEIKARDLANYYEMEDRFVSQSTSTSVSQLEQLFPDGERGNPVDKTRALMSLYLTKPSITSAQLQGLIEALQKAGGDESGLSYLQHLSSIRNMMAPAAAAPSTSGPAVGSSLMGGALGNLANTFMSKGEDFLSAGVNQLKNITQSKKELVICQILEGVMEQKPTGITENYVYLDPKAPAAALGVEVPRVRGQFRRAIAFVVGGGNYVEMQSVEEWAKANGRVVSYGSTDMVSPKIGRAHV